MTTTAPDSAPAGAYHPPSRKTVRARERERGWPRTRAFDTTFDLLREGYLFLPRRRRVLAQDMFETRLMLMKAICVGGEDAARMFYEESDRFTRKGAMPPHTAALVQGHHSVQQLDGDQHRARKAIFMEAVTPQSVKRLGEVFDETLERHGRTWRDRRRVVLLRAMEEAFTDAGFAWCGMPLPLTQVKRVAWWFHASVDGAGAAGLRAVRGLIERRSADRWGEGVFRAIRAGGYRPDPDSIVGRIARWRDADATLLTPRAATQEFFNIVRTTSAISRYVVFAALAMHQRPDLREKAAEGDDAWLTAFADEVRRFYPFVPLMGGRVMKPFVWRGRSFEVGDWVLLDLYGTNRDPEIWGDPEVFRPERFLNADPGPYAFIPQGGGRADTGHRCPGDPVVVQGIKRAAAYLARAGYEVPPQDLRINLSRIPAQPNSRFVITDFRPPA